MDDVVSRLRVFLVVAAFFSVALFVVWCRRGGAPAQAGARAPAATASETAVPVPPPPPSDRAGARHARDAMRADILDALRRRDAGARGAASPPPRPAAASPTHEDAPNGRYEPAYIQEVFRRDMFPFLRGCYDEALHRRPTLAGKLVLSFTIVGDPQVGGIVEDADFAEDSDLEDREMETCVRESLMTITFDKPPEGGGFVTVKYPVLFSPGEEGSDAGATGHRQE